MSSVNQAEPSDNSADSVQNSVIGPPPASTLRADYLKMIPPVAEKFYGEENTIAVDHWFDHLTLWMNHIGIPYGHRTGMASMLLKGDALTFWRQYADTFGDHAEWDEFQFVMRDRFGAVAEATHWTKMTKRFGQYMGETGKEYTARFLRDVVDTCPRRLRDPEVVDLYVAGLRGRYRVPTSTISPSSSFAEVRAAVEAKDTQTRPTRPPAIRDYPPGCGPSSSRQPGPAIRNSEDSEEDPEEDPEENEE